MLSLMVTHRLFVSNKTDSLGDRHRTLEAVSVFHGESSLSRTFVAIVTGVHYLEYIEWVRLRPRGTWCGACVLAMAKRSAFSVYQELQKEQDLTNDKKVCNF